MSKEYMNPQSCQETKEVQSSPEPKPGEEPRKSQSSIGTALMLICWGVLFILLLFLVKALGLSLYPWVDWVFLLLGFASLFLGAAGICLELNR